MKTKISSTGCFAITVYSVLVAAAGYILTGLTISYLWAWFIVEHFGLAPLPIRTAIGVAILVGFVTLAHTDQPQDESKNGSTVEKIAQATVTALTRPVWPLVIGYIVHSI